MSTAEPVLEKERSMEINLSDDDSQSLNSQLSSIEAQSPVPSLPSESLSPLPPSPSKDDANYSALSEDEFQNENEGENSPGNRLSPQSPSPILDDDEVAIVYQTPTRSPSYSNTGGESLSPDIPNSPSIPENEPLDEKNERLEDVDNAENEKFAPVDNKEDQSEAVASQKRIVELESQLSIEKQQREKEKRDQEENEASLLAEIERLQLEQRLKVEALESESQRNKSLCEKERESKQALMRALEDSEIGDKALVGEVTRLQGELAQEQEAHTSSLAAIDEWKGKFLTAESAHSAEVAKWTKHIDELATALVRAQREESEATATLADTKQQYELRITALQARLDEARADVESCRADLQRERAAWRASAHGQTQEAQAQAVEWQERSLRAQNSLHQIQSTHAGALSQRQQQIDALKDELAAAKALYAQEAAAAAELRKANDSLAAQLQSEREASAAKLKEAKRRAKKLSAEVQEAKAAGNPYVVYAGSEKHHGLLEGTLQRLKEEEKLTKALKKTLARERKTAREEAEDWMAEVDGLQKELVSIRNDLRRFPAYVRKYIMAQYKAAQCRYILATGDADASVAGMYEQALHDITALRTKMNLPSVGEDGPPTPHTPPAENKTDGPIQARVGSRLTQLRRTASLGDLSTLTPTPARHSLRPVEGLGDYEVELILERAARMSPGAVLSHASRASKPAVEQERPLTPPPRGEGPWPDTPVSTRRPLPQTPTSVRSASRRGPLPPTPTTGSRTALFDADNESLQLSESLSSVVAFDDESPSENRYPPAQEPRRPTRDSSTRSLSQTQGPSARAPARERGPNSRGGRRANREAGMYATVPISLESEKGSRSSRRSLVLEERPSSRGAESGRKSARKHRRGGEFAPAAESGPGPRGESGEGGGTKPQQQSLTTQSLADNLGFSSRPEWENALDEEAREMCIMLAEEELDKANLALARRAYTEELDILWKKGFTLQLFMELVSLRNRYELAPSEKKAYTQQLESLVVQLETQRDVLRHAQNEHEKELETLRPATAEADTLRQELQQLRHAVKKLKKSEYVLKEQLNEISPDEAGAADSSQRGRGGKGCILM